MSNRGLWVPDVIVFSPHHSSIYLFSKCQSLIKAIIPAVKVHSFWTNGGRTWKRPEMKSSSNHSCYVNVLTTVISDWFNLGKCFNHQLNELIRNEFNPYRLDMLSLMRWFESTVNQIITMIRSAYAGRDWLLPHGLMGRDSSSVVSPGEADSSSWLSGVTAPPDREHSVRSSCNGDTFTRQMQAAFTPKLKFVMKRCPRCHPQGLHICIPENRFKGENSGMNCFAGGQHFSFLSFLASSSQVFPEASPLLAAWSGICSRFSGPWRLSCKCHGWKMCRTAVVVQKAAQPPSQTDTMRVQCWKSGKCTV